MNELLMWEINWINSNHDMYDSPIHAKTVIENITKKHYLGRAKELFTETEIEAIIATGAISDLFEYFDNDGS